MAEFNRFSALEWSRRDTLRRAASSQLEPGTEAHHVRLTHTTSLRPTPAFALAFVVTRPTKPDEDAAMALPPDRPSRLLDPEFTDPQGPYQNADHPRHAAAVDNLAQIIRTARGSIPNRAAMPTEYPSVQDMLASIAGPAAGSPVGATNLPMTKERVNQFTATDEWQTTSQSQFPSLPLGAVGARLAQLRVLPRWRQVAPPTRRLPRNTGQSSLDHSNRAANSPRPPTQPNDPMGSQRLNRSRAHSDLYQSNGTPRLNDAPSAIGAEVYIRGHEGYIKPHHVFFDNTSYNAYTLKDLILAAMVKQPSRLGQRPSIVATAGNSTSPATPEPRPPKTTPPDLLITGARKMIHDAVSNIGELWSPKKESNAIGNVGEEAVVRAVERTGVSIVGRQVHCRTNNDGVRKFDLLVADDDGGLAGIRIDSPLLNVESKANTGRRDRQQRWKDDVIAREGCKIVAGHDLKYGYRIGDWIMANTLEARTKVGYP